MMTPPDTHPRDPMQKEAQQPQAYCPYLGIDASNHRLGEAVEYPSFENRCWTTTRPIPILLTDQATLCLCKGYMHCPRFLAARAARTGQERPATVPPPADSDSITSALRELEADVQATTTAQAKSRRRWGWIGAGIIFMSSLLCGGLFAAYVGWQMVSEEIASTPPGSIDTLAQSAQAQTELQPQTYIIQTATTAPQPIIVAQLTTQPLGQPAASDHGGDQGSAQDNSQSYPEAVHPTPSLGTGTQQQPQQPPPSLSQIAQETNNTVIDPIASPTQILDFELEIPTRRPTPVLDIPTSTPAFDATPTPQEPQPTPTPMPPLGTPVVIFYAEDRTMEQGDCTTVYWHVENVKAVYYENLGVDGRGEKEECIRDDDPGEYHLMIVMPNGATQNYTVTVGVLLPTATPEATPTRTPIPMPTATWTPNTPTETPTPPTNYGAQLEAGSDTEQSCSRGASCEFDFYVTNTGSAIDSITVRFTEAAKWPHQICRLDGVCHDSQMTLVNMGASASGVVRLRVTVPEDASDETMIYRLQAVSDNSGSSSHSNIITVEVTAQ